MQWIVKSMNQSVVNEWLEKENRNATLLKIILFLMYMISYGVFKKNNVFNNSSLAYIAARDLQSSQCNASVQSLLLAVNFLYNQ